MRPFYINEADGAVQLPSGLCITDALTKDALLADSKAASARTEDYGTLPWIHCGLNGGEVQGKPLLVSVCFYDQLLVSVSVTADLYPPGPKDWSSYSLEVEAATKRFHERLLSEMFTAQPIAADLVAVGEPSHRDDLSRPLFWRFAWGEVSSYHDSKGGGTSIYVGYGNRKHQCTREYQTRKSS